MTATARLGWGDPQGLDLTFRASEVMATAFIAVKLVTTTGAEGTVAIAGDGEEAIGILQNTAAAVGDAVQVRVSGTTKVSANGAFSIGDLLNSGAADGQLDTKGSTEHAICKALEEATAANDLVLALIRPIYV